MKRPLRLLLVLPMVLFAILHYWVFNPDEKAYGLVHLMLKGLFVVFFLIAITTSYFSLFASLHRRQIKFEILLLTIFSVSLLTVIYTLTLRGHASGKTWLVAESSDSNTSQTLTLKENGNFTISLNAEDFGVDYSGKYMKKGDTVFLDRKTIEKIHEKVSPVYIVLDSTLIPAPNGSQFNSFKVKNVK